MKVLHVVPSFYPAFAYGGTTTSVYALCGTLAEQGCELRVLTTNSNGIGQVMEVDTRAPVTLPPGISVRYCRKIARNSISPQLLRQLMPAVRWADIVHLTAVYNFPTLPTMAACRWEGKPLVWSPRGALQRWQQSRRRGLKALWDRFARWIAPAGTVLHVTSTQEAAESALRFPHATAVVIPNGVEVPAELEPPQPVDCLRLLFLGRIDPKKGIENLLEACRALDGRLARPWSLTVAGSGDPAYTATLRQKAQELQLGSKMHFVGEVRNAAKSALFARSDIAVFPSHTENFAMVVAEALAHAVPVIASKGTPWSAVESHGCGLWVDNDPGSLADAMVRMSESPLPEMGQRGRRWMQEEFNWARVAREMVTVYGKLVRSSGQNARSSENYW
jgi:glycosyltransferase involved in cell wall biosynthesis